MKILTNKSLIRTFGHDLTNITKNKDNIKLNKKSSSYNNDKVSQIQ